MSERIRAFVGLGSNLGDRQALLAAAIAGFDDCVGVSRLYETAPIGGPQQSSYLNMVAELSTDLGPFELLETCRRLEREAQRVRRVRWGPRTLDVDVLLYGDLKLEDDVLTIPHPRMWDRRFVLAPLRDLAPDLVSDEALAVVADQQIECVGELSVGNTG